MKLSLVSKLWIFGTVLIGNLLGVGVLAYLSTQTLSKDVDVLGVTYLPAIRNMTLVDMMHDGIRANVYRAIVHSGTKDEKELADIKEEGEKFRTNIKAYLENIEKLPLKPRIRKSIEPLKPTIEEYVKASSEVAAIAISGKPVAAIEALGKFNELFEKLEKELEVVGTAISKDAQEAKDFAIRDGRRYLNVVVGTVALCFGLGFIVVLWTILSFRRSLAALVSQIDQEANAVAGASKSVSHSSHDLSSATSQQAAAIEETASSMEEMSSMLSQTSQQASRSLGVAETGQQSARTGREVIAKLKSAMDEVYAANSKLDTLEKLITEIKEKTLIINDIVSETRLLSFNASIEAARAGAQGKGFAVVAEEVGKLAAMSGKAADEIRRLLDSTTDQVRDVVKGTQERVTIGKRVSDECETAFTTMGDTLDKIAESINLISNAAREQEIGVNQTNKAMNEMDRATQHNAQSSETLTAQAGALAAGAQNLQSVIKALETTIFGANVIASEGVPAEEFKSESNSETVGIDSPALESLNSPSESMEPAENRVIEPIVKPSIVAQVSAAGAPKVTRADARWKSAS